MIYFVAFAMFILSEAILFFLVFRILATMVFSAKHQKEQPLSLIDFLKGAVERFVVAFALFHGMQQILTLFGAMKLGTRLKNTDDDKGVNNFYLIGNMISVLVAIIYSIWLSPQAAIVVGAAGWLAGIFR